MSDLLERLRGRGWRMTAQRRVVAEVLDGEHVHLTADEVHSRAVTRLPEISRATVYNTLNLFVEKKLIREVIVDPNKVFYDPNTAPHHHFYNVDTGDLTDIEAGTIEISRLPQLPECMVTAGVDVIVRIRSAV